jgi:hypothetical protein
LIAAGAVGAILFLTGCASDGSAEKPSHAFGNTGNQQSVSNHAGADSFPTAAQAGL